MRGQKYGESEIRIDRGFSSKHRKQNSIREEPSAPNKSSKTNKKYTTDTN